MESLQDYIARGEYVKAHSQGDDKSEPTTISDSFDYDDFWKARDGDAEYVDPVLELIRSEIETYKAFLINLNSKKDEDANVITPYDFTFALLYAINFVEKEPLNLDKAKEMGFWLFSFFGFSDVIIDNILSTDDREMFYVFEERGLLRQPGAEEVVLNVGMFAGYEWRIARWELDKKKIRDYENKMLAELMKEGVAEAQPDSIELYSLETRVVSI